MINVILAIMMPGQNIAQQEFKLCLRGSIIYLLRDDGRTGVS